MCYRVEIKTGIEKIAQRYKAKVKNPENLVLGQEVNGFAFAKHPIITSEDPNTIETDYHWGLVPPWCKDDSIRKSTLNARIETVGSKPAFSEVVNNRCLMIATGYYEWRWNDEKGKSKQKFEIHSAEEEIFSLAGIYSVWQNPANGEHVKTFSIITTRANAEMEYIHNNKKRMPLMLRREDELQWLDTSTNYETFAYPNYNAAIIAFTVN